MYSQIGRPFAPFSNTAYGRPSEFVELIGDPTFIVETKQNKLIDMLDTKNKARDFIIRMRGKYRYEIINDPSFPQSQTYTVHEEPDYEFNVGISYGALNYAGYPNDQVSFYSDKKNIYMPLQMGIALSFDEQPIQDGDKIFVSYVCDGINIPVFSKLKLMMIYGNPAFPITSDLSISLSPVYF